MARQTPVWGAKRCVRSGVSAVVCPQDERCVRSGVSTEKRKGRSPPAVLSSPAGGLKGSQNTSAQGAGC